MSEPPISYEQAKAELTEIVSTMESGTPSLTETMKLWERAQELANVCTTWLDGAQQAIEKTPEPT